MNNISKLREWVQQASSPLYAAAASRSPSFSLHNKYPMHFFGSNLIYKSNFTCGNWFCKMFSTNAIPVNAYLHICSFSIFSAAIFLQKRDNSWQAKISQQLKFLCGGPRPIVCDSEVRQPLHTCLCAQMCHTCILANNLSMICKRRTTDPWCLKAPGKITVKVFEDKIRW